MTAIVPQIPAGAPVVAPRRAPRAALALGAWGTAAAAGAAVPAAFLCASAFGLRLPVATVALLSAGALVSARAAAHRFRVAAVVGLGALLLTNAVFGLYEALLVAALFALRRRPWLFLSVAALFCLVLPKALFFFRYHQPGYYNWLSEAHLALVFFVSLVHARATRDGRVPPLPDRDEPWAWATLYWLPGHVANPMVFGARDLWNSPGFDARGSARALARLAAKSALYLVWLRAEPVLSFAHLTPAGVREAGFGRAWSLAFWNYGATLLQLSGTAELAVTLAHLFGFSLAPAFRWAFLAPHPVELWRRWGIYNRKILLSLIYFPLGGKDRHQIRNVFLTFLGSAWLLHSGWFGSKYATVGVGGWRDEALYFLLQGTAVAGTLVWQRRRAVGAVTARPRGWTLALGVLVTQAFSAWAHVLVLPQSVPLPARLRLMLTCLGLG